ncbi:hypothetical protein [Streptomyces sp. CB03234]|nr:hypothetical protein [Streptomyces sp. CB03234]
MSIRAVLVAALLTGFVLGIAAPGPDHSPSPRGTGSVSGTDR